MTEKNKQENIQEELFNLEYFDIQLRPYQKQIVKSLKDRMQEGVKSPVMCAPTGAGKTVMFSWMANENNKRGYATLIVVHRQELLRQCVNTLSYMGMDSGLVYPGEKLEPDKMAYVCMVETLYNRLNEDLDFLEKNIDLPINLVVFDEAHIRSFVKLMPFVQKDRYIIPVTATPRFTTPGPCMGSVYENIVDECSIKELIDDGFLVKEQTYSFSHDFSKLRMSGGEYSRESQKREFESAMLLGGLIDNFNSICPWAKTICYNVDIAHSKMVCSEFNSNNINAVHVDSKMNNEDRKEIMESFADNKFQVLCNVGIVTAGYDEPSVQCIIQNFCTKSDTKYFQTAGRGARICNHWVEWSEGEAIINHEAKSGFFILDMGQNFTRFGCWSDDYDWLGAFKSGNMVFQEEAEIKRYICPACNSVYEGRKCGNCDYIRPVEPKFTKKKYEDIKPSKLELVKNQAKNYCKKGSLEYYIYICASRGFKPGWVYHQFKERPGCPDYKEIRAMVNIERLRQANEKIAIAKEIAHEKERKTIEAYSFSQKRGQP